MQKKPFLIVAVFILFLFSLFIGIDHFIHRKSHHFSYSKISAYQVYSEEWNFSPLSAEEQEELDQIFSQSFTFYGKGTYAYLFLSEDHNYIIKFLKQNITRPKSWLAYIPASFNPYYQEYLEKQTQLNKMFTAYKTAFNELKEETGLIYVHINPTHTLCKEITIYDKNEKSHTIDLDKTSFYVQKRAQLIYPRISELMRRGDIDCAKEIITSVFSLIERLGKKGIIDTDSILYKNFGIIDDKAVHIDIGKLHANASSDLNYKQEVENITLSFKNWIKKNYPELLPHFEEKLHNLK